MEYAVGERYPITPKDVQALINLSGSRFTGILMGPVDLSRGRRFAKEPGDWELWNKDGHKISASMNPSIGTVVISVAKEPDPDRPEPLTR